jgi:hypothetical protein
VKVTTLIPTRRNDGSRVSGRERAEIVAKFWQRFGGSTIEGKTQGDWVDPVDGTHYRDECWKLVVVTSPEQWPEVEQLIAEVGHDLGQKAMFVEVQYFDGVRILRIE